MNQQKMPDNIGRKLWTSRTTGRHFKCGKLISCVLKHAIIHLSYVYIVININIMTVSVFTSCAISSILPSSRVLFSSRSLSKRMLFTIDQWKSWYKVGLLKKQILHLCRCQRLIKKSGVSLEAGYWRSTVAYFASHCRLLNLTFKRVVVVISSTEMGRNNNESLYFIL